MTDEEKHIVYRDSAGRGYALDELDADVAALIRRCEGQAESAKSHAQRAEYHRNEALKARGAAQALSDAADELFGARQRETGGDE